MMRKWLAFGLAWALILGGAFLAHSIQTTGGTTVSEVRIAAAPGVTVSGLLYTPRNATAATPAPAVLVSHGYINTREMQSPFAIELSRRGFVVLSMDMTGHGYSGGIVGTADFGGPAALRYLRSLPVVDKANVGLEGHSMGGGPILAAAAEIPDGYRSIVLEGSTPGLLGAKAPANPRNLAVVFGQFDEFAGLMWQVPKGSLVATSPKLQKLFGLSGPVEVDQHLRFHRRRDRPGAAEPAGDTPLGALLAGRRRRGDRLVPEDAARAACPAADRPDLALEGDRHPDRLHRHGRADPGHLRPAAGLEDLRRPEPSRPSLWPNGGTASWWLSFAVTAALPAITYFPLMKIGQIVFPIGADPAVDPEPAAGLGAGDGSDQPDHRTVPAARPADLHHRAGASRLWRRG